MSYCLNPTCQQPQNPDSAKFCRNCGTKLLLGDRYRALKVIGQGGFGKTFLAVDEAESHKPYCVIKQSLPPRLNNLSAQRVAQLFRREAERLAELGQHLQIPELLNHFESDDAQYLVQEFIDGQNLEDALTEGGPFNEAEILQLLEDILPVLQFIHEHQVIHRDIKPENIICPYQGDKLVLVDFGAAKYATGTALARTGTVIGSAGYVAPEQAMGRAEFGSDLYSLGVTCIHLLTEIHPFDLYSISEDRWVWQQYLAEPISEQLQRILDRMLQRATSRRYRSAIAVLRDLLGLEPRSVSISKPKEFSIAAQPLTKAALARLPRTDSAIAPTLPWACIRTLTGHAGGVTAVTIRPDGRTLASGSSDKTIKLWNLATGDILHTFAGRSLWFGSGHTDRITALLFTSDGHTLVSSSDDGTVKFWDIVKPKLLKTLPGHEWGISAIALSQTSEILAVGSGDGLITLWHPDTQELAERLTKHQEQISGLVLSPNGQTLASSSCDKTIRLWNLRTGQLVNTWKGHVDRISAIAVTPDWRTLISGSWDKTLKLWDLPSGELLKTVAAHADRLTCLAISPTGQLLASGSEDSSIKLWNLERGFGDRPFIHITRLCTLKQTWTVNTLSFSPDGQTLASGSADETIKIWQRNL
jgi:WD40 repeat protein/tRNA A-37 threonylcarbamoyl transferase component Bud32